MGKNRKYTNIVAEGRILPNLKEVGQMLFTFIMAVIGWILFRSDTIGNAWLYMTGLFNTDPMSVEFGKMDALTYLFWPVLMLVIEWAQRTKQHGLSFDGLKLPVVMRWGIYVAMIVVICLNVHTNSAFIYFQF